MDKFVNRLSFILEQYEHTASSFSDKIGVQRSSLSHLLSGRNKPSLDFILKINEAYPEINLYWLLKGEGSYLTNDKHPPMEVFNEDSASEKKVLPISPTLFDNTIINEEIEKKKEDEKIIEQNTTPTIENQINILESKTNQSIDQIVIFYSDGTFKNYNPKK